VFYLELVAASFSNPAVVIMMERVIRRSVDPFAMANLFHLTPREGQAVEFLTEGLSTKEIANRMGIRPQTVRIFLRTAMIKTGVSTPSGIVAKIMETWRIQSPTRSHARRRRLSNSPAAFRLPP
jgi:DNA-binding CsgD family transcriptional regulator